MLFRGDGRVVVCIGITHSRDELVLQALLERLVGIGNAVELGGRALQKVERQLEWYDRVVRGRRGLEFERRFATKGQELEETGPVHLIRIDPERGARWVFVAELERHGEEDPWEFKRRAQAQLVAVDLGTVIVELIAGLPFVGAFHLDIEGLAAAKNVAFGHAEDGTRTDLVVAFAGDVNLQLAIDGQVVGGVDAQVERVLPARRVSGRILHIRVAEDAETRQGGLALFLLVLRVELAALEEEPVINHLGAYPEFSLIMDGQVLIADRVGWRLVLVTGQVEGDVADSPWTKRPDGRSARMGKPSLGLTRRETLPGESNVSAS